MKYETLIGKNKDEPFENNDWWFDLADHMENPSGPVTFVIDGQTFTASAEEWKDMVRCALAGVQARTALTGQIGYELPKL